MSDSFEQFAKEHGLCMICAGSGIKPVSLTGSPDDITTNCPHCNGTGDEPKTKKQKFIYAVCWILEHACGLFCHVGMCKLASLSESLDEATGYQSGYWQKKGKGTND